MLSSLTFALVLVGEPSSLTSLKLERRPSGPSCPFEPECLWGNFTPRRDLLVIVVALEGHEV